MIIHGKDGMAILSFDEHHKRPENGQKIAGAEESADKHVPVASALSFPLFAVVNHSCDCGYCGLPVLTNSWAYRGWFACLAFDSYLAANRLSEAAQFAGKSQIM